jgi:hypothetical protein
MAGFSSQDNLISSITTSGKFWRADWNKLFNPTAAAVAGEWHTFFRGGGNPPADAIFNAGTNLLGQHVYDVTASAGALQHGGNVGASATDFKVVLNASAFSASATTMPGVLMLIDLLAFYRVTSVTTATAQTTINSNTFTASSSSGLLLTYTNDFGTYTKVRFTSSGTLPTGLSLATDYWLVRVSATTARVATSLPNAVAGTVIAYTDAGTGTHTLTLRLPRYSDGAGVQALFFNSNSTALGAATPNLTLPSYTNAAGTASRATPSSPSSPVGKTAASNSHILYSGATAAGKFGPFVPLQAGDTGIASIQQIQNSVSYVSGEYTVALAKPILTLPLTTIGVAGEREFGSQLPSFPRIYDGAALYWLYYSGANTPANSAFYGHLDLGWT